MLCCYNTSYGIDLNPDVTYEEVTGPTHYNDPCMHACQPIIIFGAFNVHKSGNERTIEMPGETYWQEVNLKSNEAYCVRGDRRCKFADTNNDLTPTSSALSFLEL